MYKLSNKMVNEKVKLEKVIAHTDDGMRIKELEGLSFDFRGEIYLIKNISNEVVGAIDFRIIQTCGDIYIELLEIKSEYKRQNYAAATIEVLKGMCEGNIFGQSLPDENIKYIWECLGADFDSCYDSFCPYDSFDECEEYCDNPADYSFGIKCNVR